MFVFVCLYVSLCSHGCPGTPSAQDWLELRILPLSFNLLGLKACAATTKQLKTFFLMFYIYLLGVGVLVHMPNQSTTCGVCFSPSMIVDLGTELKSSHLVTSAFNCWVIPLTHKSIVMYRVLLQGVGPCLCRHPDNLHPK